MALLITVDPEDDTASSTEELTASLFAESNNFMSILRFLHASFGLWKLHYALKPEPHKVFSALEREESLNCDGKGGIMWELVWKVLHSQSQLTVLGWCGDPARSWFSFSVYESRRTKQCQPGEEKTAKKTPQTQELKYVFIVALFAYKPSFNPSQPSHLNFYYL